MEAEKDPYIEAINKVVEQHKPESHLEAPDGNVPPPPSMESINVATHGEYFKECHTHRDLLNQIQVVVPVRPDDGINCNLSRMLSIWYGEGVAWQQCNDHMGGFIEVTRANIAWHFMNNSDKNLKYLLMIDNDMEPAMRLPYMLARHDKALCSGVAVGYAAGYGPQLCFTLRDTRGDRRFPTLHSGFKLPTRGLLKVEEAGTGCLMIRRDVLEAFSWEGDDIPFFVPEDVRRAGMKTGTLLIGEDIRFCQQVKEKGFDCFVDCEANVGHRKNVSIVWPETAFDDELSPEDIVMQPKGRKIYDIPDLMKLAEE